MIGYWQTCVDMKLFKMALIDNYWHVSCFTFHLSATIVVGCEIWVNYILVLHGLITLSWCDNHPMLKARSMFLDSASGFQGCTILSLIIIDIIHLEMSLMWNLTAACFHDSNCLCGILLKTSMFVVVIKRQDHNGIGIISSQPNSQTNSTNSGQLARANWSR